MRMSKIVINHSVIHYMIVLRNVQQKQSLMST